MPRFDTFPTTGASSATGEAASGEAASGEAIFARYAYPPNQLGFCGPGDGSDLLDFADRAGRAHGVGRATAPLDMAQRAQAFDGAWLYLQYLADRTGLDPMHPRVLEAYWLGNDLLEATAPESFSLAVTTAFGGQHGADLEALQANPHPLPNHSFHVFSIYPWVAVLRRTGAQHALRVLDQCRIRWGQIQSIDGDEVVVCSAPLSWDGAVLALGSAVPQTARLSEAGRSLAADVRVGDWVALHWDWVCDRLSAAQLEALTITTARQLSITNRAAGRPVESTS